MVSTGAGGIHNSPLSRHRIGAVRGFVHDDGTSWTCHYPWRVLGVILKPNLWRSSLVESRILYAVYCLFDVSQTRGNWYIRPQVVYAKNLEFEVPR